MKNKYSFKVLGIEHIGIALNDNSKISSFLALLPGLKEKYSEIVEDQKVNTEIYNIKNTKIELLNSISSKSKLEKFIKKRGNAIHHIALRVDNLNNAINNLIKKGIVFIDKKPRKGAENYLIAFIHPKSTSGILFELCQYPD